MDFIIISYLFFLVGVPLPAIAAGEDFTHMGPATYLLRGWYYPFTFYVLCFIYYVLRIIYYVLYIIFYVLCFMFYVICNMFYVIRIT